MRRVAAALDAVGATRSRKAKAALLAALLRSLDDVELPIVARLMLGLTLPVGDPRTLGVGWALVSDAAAEVAGVPAARVAHQARALGDVGGALEQLLPAKPCALSVRDVGALFDQLASLSDRDEKRRALLDAFRAAGPAEAKYLVKTLFGELRIGVQRGIFEDALAAAFELPLAALHATSALTPDPGALALLAKRRTLDQAVVSVGSVIGFMLATPNETVKEPLEVALTAVEDKLDGVRVQAHVRGEEVRLFARGQGEVTSTFPEVVRSLRALTAPTILDGEIIAVTPDGRPRPFQALQARLGRAPSAGATLESTPVAYVVFDVLFHRAALLDQPWSERRAVLESLPVRVNPVTRLHADQPAIDQLDALFNAARARGHEGLVLKRVDAPYEAGRRGSAWRKVKRAYATLDCVITRAERGHGKRAGVLSDYTFAVWSGPKLVEIGKAYSGLTDAEIRALTTRLEALTVERSGRYWLVKPEIVLEIAFDGLQESTRHASGFALRFPRIARIRDDKKPEAADRLETARALFDAQVASGHREPKKQLSLFD